MFVTLAVPYDGHKPDESVEVDDVTGKQLIRDGYARRAEAPEQTAPAAPAESAALQPAQPTSDRPTTGKSKVKE